MIDLRKLRKWRGQTQKDFAALAKILQGTLSDIESGKSSASKALMSYIVEQCTPTILFIHHSDYAPMIANAMLQAGQIDVLEHEPDAFNSALKRGLSIGVITDDKTPFLALIEQAVSDSGLPIIPWRGLQFINNEWREWND